MFYISKKLKDACIGHRLGKGYDGACKNLHGHNYKFEVTMKAEGLDQYDMAIDFKDIKRVCDEYIQNNMDHVTFVADWDFDLLEYVQKAGTRYYLIPNGYNSTAEWFAKHLFEVFEQAFPVMGLYNAKLESVKVWETDSCFCEFKRDQHGY